MAVAEETEGDGKHEHDRAGNIGCSMGVSGLTANDRNQNGQSGGGEQHAAGVDADAANPFLEVIAVGFENKPLVAEKGERDGEQIPEQAGEHVSIGEERGQQHREQGKTAIAKCCIDNAHGQIAKERGWDGPRLGRGGHDGERASTGCLDRPRQERMPGINSRDDSRLGWCSEGYDRYQW